MNINSVRKLQHDRRLRAVDGLRAGAEELTLLGYSADDIAQETRDTIAEYLSDTELADSPPLQPVALRTL